MILSRKTAAALCVAIVLVAGLAAVDAAKKAKKKGDATVTHKVPLILIIMGCSIATMACGHNTRSSTAVYVHGLRQCCPLPRTPLQVYFDIEIGGEAAGDYSCLVPPAHTLRHVDRGHTCVRAPGPAWS